MLVRRWVSVVDVVPALYQHYVDISCWLGVTSRERATSNPTHKTSRLNSGPYRVAPFKCWGRKLSFTVHGLNTEIKHKIV